MPQAGAETTTAEAFSAFATFLGTPLPDDPITALRILRSEAEAEVERLIEFLDATGPDPDLDRELGDDYGPGDGGEADNSDTEPSAGWTDREAGGGKYADDMTAGEGEQLLGWTTDGQLGRNGHEAEQDLSDYEPWLAGMPWIGGYGQYDLEQDTG